MPLTATQKSGLQSDVQALSDAVNALTVDPIPNPLQVQLDAAQAQIVTLQQGNTALQAKIDAAKAAMARADAADVSEDQARADALAALT
jgi:multidrug resistance efflux pump